MTDTLAGTTPCGGKRDHTIVLLYGRDGTHGSFPQVVSAARFNLEWLTDGADSVQ